MSSIIYTMLGTIAKKTVPSMTSLMNALEHYDVGRVISVKRGGGTANANFIIRAEEGVFFLRLRNPKYSNVTHIRDDHRLIEFLRKRKVPAPRLIPTKTGATFVKSDIGAYELSAYVDGDLFDGSCLEIAEASRWLARLHRNGRDWKPAELKVTIPKRYDRPDDFIPRWVEILQGAGRHDDLDYIVSQGELAREWVDDEKYDSLSDWTIHGDYIPANVLFTKGKLAGIFDFDWAGRHPRLRDLADLLMGFCSHQETTVQSEDIAAVTRCFTFDAKKIKIGLKSYGEILPLSKEDVELLPAFIRRRWIYSRAAATFKVAPESRLEVLTEGFKEPLIWLDENGEKVFSDPDLV